MANFDDASNQQSVGINRGLLDAVSSQLDSCQFGALKGRSTTHALVDMLQHWHSVLDDGHSVRVLFVDYVKAFDHIDYNIVIQKLKSLCVPDFTVCLSERPQRVKISNILSEWISTRGGMPQSS